ncbi:hypothetical protein OY671_012031, partial [Metschnikowia pulcherrima]
RAKSARSAAWIARTNAIGISRREARATVRRNNPPPATAPRAPRSVSSSMLPVSLADIRAARRRIRGGVVVTPCPESIPLSEITGAHIYCKSDNLQRTGSFKERGARNASSQLTRDQRKRGVIAASAGNHA